MIVIHGALLDAVHPHPAPAVPTTCLMPPPAPIDCDVGETENVLQELHSGVLSNCEVLNRNGSMSRYTRDRYLRPR